MRVKKKKKKKLEAGKGKEGSPPPGVQHQLDPPTPLRALIHIHTLDQDCGVKPPDRAAAVSVEQSGGQSDASNFIKSHVTTDPLCIMSRFINIHCLFWCCATPV